MKSAVASLLFVLLVGCNQTDNYVRTFGDSLTAAVDSWAFMMHENDWAVVYNHARGGLTWRDFTAPDWLHCDHKEQFRRKVLIWLGSNDALHGNTHDVRPHMARSLDILTAKGCEVYLVLPPESPPIEWPSDPARWAEVRSQMVETALEYGIVPHEVVYDWGETVDTLHATPEQHERVAIQMSAILELAWRTDES